MIALSSTQRTARARSPPGLTSAIVFWPAIVVSPLRRAVYLTNAARLDIERLHDFLFEKNSDAARRLIAQLQANFERLAEYSERDRLVGGGVRELIVPFGGSRYVVRYETDARGVFVSRVWHGLEQR
ncbi:type II toxin-antitoxin system RelE/ParE family toxin [Caulobacter sp. BP25]|uniref:type II toxin-antitoxin system RelE/ParE family toxin n=1 Tax=Caulobacter sp. BP25 TaxID=2048900 RepID=UPI001374791F